MVRETGRHSGYAHHAHTASGAHMSEEQTVGRKIASGPYVLFLVAAFTLCLVPSLGMIFWPTTQTTENRAISSAPVLFTDEGRINVEVFDEFDDWFTDHMALRNQMVYADVVIQTQLFDTSPVDGVIYGTDGWLYYTATLDDYLGNDPMSDRELYNLAHNVALVQQWLDNRDISFVLMIPPNKNTLYPDHMPERYHAGSAEHNAERLAAYLENEQVNYVNLFSLFEAEPEQLYLKRDSHWNAKGAALVYEAMMSKLNAEYTDITSSVPQKMTVYGDLNRMLYGLYGTVEDDYDYGVGQNYVFDREGASVEDGMLAATSLSAPNGCLLMFRDSFANTLIPLAANEFTRSVWSKGQPNALERYVNTYEPDGVVIEQVERNIAQYLNDPPLISAVPVSPAELTAPVYQQHAQVQVEACAHDVTFTQISGSLSETGMSSETEILVSVDEVLYHPYQTGETGFLLYLGSETNVSEDTQIFVFITNNDISR